MLLIVDNYHGDNITLIDKLEYLMREFVMSRVVWAEFCDGYHKSTAVDSIYSPTKQNT